MNKLAQLVTIGLFTITLAACGGSSDSSSSQPEPPAPTPDTTPPVITLSGDASITITVGEAFTDPGATATDNIDGTVAVTVDTPNLDAVGTYTVTYTATDAANNQATATRTVIVEAAPDTTPPVITLNGDASITITEDDTYTEAGASATDDVDGTIDVTISGSVGQSVGTYTLTYEASDAAGNQAMVTRTVIVEAAPDSTAPVITLNGSSIIRLELGQAYVEEGASANDDVDGSINVVISGTVGQSLGSYTITYTATDAAGNSANASRTVNIVSSTPVSDMRQDVLVANQVDPVWNNGLQAFDQALGFGNCNNDSVACPSMEWTTVTDAERGDVLQITHKNGNQLAGFFISSSTPQNLTEFAQGSINFDIKVVSGATSITFKLDCVFPCTSGDVLLGAQPSDEWVTVSYNIQTLINSGLDITKVDTGIVIWASETTDTVFLLDNVFFSTEAGTDVEPELPDFTDFTAMTFGAGNISDTINPNSYKCVFDFGNWIYNAGVVEPGIAGCDTTTGTPQGTPTKLFPHVSGPAATRPLANARWWGSVSFSGEMEIGNPNDAAYITPDPMTARITQKGVRILGIPSGLKVQGNDFLYAIPDPFSEVFDGIAVGNTEHDDLDARLKDNSDGSVTVAWHDGSDEVMQATFVHGSPHAFFEVYQGEMQIRTLRADGGEKGIFYNQGNTLGVWTSVAGNANNFLISGDSSTTFADIASQEITLSSDSKAYTVTLLPLTSGTPTSAMIDAFVATASNVIAKVDIDYAVDHSTNSVTITHAYKNSNGDAVSTMAGMQPLHWKNSATQTSAYSIRSARGITKFANVSSFSYTIQFVGILPALPSVSQDLDTDLVTALVNEFVDQGASTYNNRVDAYWAGKNYGKVSELIGLTDQMNLTTQRDALVTWLKTELEDWFTASTDGNLDVEKYFAYDDDWDTLLAMEESFASHQQLNDHHFHYGYLVRAAAEVCRFDSAWCGSDQYGPMIELLIRDFAAGRNDDMFPYLRHFDPANGFSWASGRVNFARGNNNESTSEAANAYGAIILYGMLTNNQELIDRGIYLHASTAASYWEYWNNIDGYNTNDPSLNNFPDGYNRITTSIIWGDGAVFSTWFSGAFAHILGIQGLPTNTLSLHIGQYADYLADYVELGLSESSNNKPSGLIPDQWRDIWWKIWSMTDANAAFADYETLNSYEPEAGETKAHTYYWIKQWQTLGQMKTGSGDITADYPSALMFENSGTKHYVVYNFNDTELTVTYSDGTEVQAAPNDFTVVSN
ncbi:immunoglobulin-like domain-containing protein [Glaciecola petra]|uniref:glucan endo-1,3-beta-D-glucosidase n=1 Tax=Glaciecola petra TaxID=3075602 RepID=A0ABU2ZPQ5_9ALTE|nr:immunoglobulin-like domain-containing protein [Aestuariibacter sp. P117]MDT0594580.1 DUF5011 domain-containing protein [Aestuariibacter sp. P117]